MMKSTKMMELRTVMRAPATKPVIDVAVKNGHQRVRRQDPDKGQRNRRR